jgi:hypothetical protein
MQGEQSQALRRLASRLARLPRGVVRAGRQRAKEAQRRVDTFRSLLGSDVAFLLVDGQRLLDNAGEEERYLKSLLSSFRTGLLRLEDELLEDGKPLVRFPRIWVLALSKADLLPELDVFGFRDLVIGKAGDDLAELRKVLEGFVDSPEALAVGEDFVVLSSAKFEPNRIEVTERIGVDLVLPMAAMLPLERHIKWVERLQLGTKVIENLLAGTAVLAGVFLGKSMAAGSKAIRVGIKRLLVAMISREAVDKLYPALSRLTVDQLRRMQDEAIAKKDYMAAVLVEFQLGLEQGEKDRVLFRSQR